MSLPALPQELFDLMLHTLLTLPRGFPSLCKLRLTCRTLATKTHCTFVLVGFSTRRIDFSTRSLRDLLSVSSYQGGEFGKKLRRLEVVEYMGDERYTDLDQRWTNIVWCKVTLIESLRRLPNLADLSIAIPLSKGESESVLSTGKSPNDFKTTTSVWSLVLGSIAFSGTKLENIELGSESTWSSKKSAECCLSEVFSMDKSMLTAFSQLRKFAIVVALDGFSWQKIETKPWWELMTFLDHTRLLTDLSISHEYRHTADRHQTKNMMAHLADLHFPHLKRLHLSACIGDAKALTRMFEKHAETLQVLELERMLVTFEKWAAVLGPLRELVRNDMMNELQRVWLYQLGQGHNRVSFPLHGEVAYSVEIEGREGMAEMLEDVIEVLDVRSYVEFTFLEGWANTSDF